MEHLTEELEKISLYPIDASPLFFGILNLDNPFPYIFSHPHFMSVPYS